MNRLVDYDFEDGEIETDEADMLETEKHEKKAERISDDPDKMKTALLEKTSHDNNFYSNEFEVDDITVDDDIDEQSTLVSNVCIICQIEGPKYRCPACEMKTCSVKCCQRHKFLYGCDGSIRRSRMVPLSKYDNLTMLNDYRFLEEAARLRENCQKQNQFVHSPINFKSWNMLKQECRRRRINLLRLSNGLEKNLTNRTSFDRNADTVFWNVDWIFVNAKNLKVQTQRIPETVSLSTLLQQILHPKPWSDHIEDSKKLTHYELSEIKCFLKVERNRWTSDQRFYELDLQKNLKENLTDKTVIEYPTIFACLSDCTSSFNILTEESKTKLNQPRAFQTIKRRIRRKRAREKKISGRKNTQIDDISSKIKDKTLKKKRKKSKRRRRLTSQILE